MSLNNLYVALIHYPVMNKKDQPIGSALTTIDLHDIARASATFGVKGFYVVTPYEDQALLANQVIEHWTKGVGGSLNPDRKRALGCVRVVKRFEDVISEVKNENGLPVVTIATSAKQADRCISPAAINDMLKDKVSHVIVFGTAWGLAEELINDCDYMLAPIYGNTDYNHLSVRSAVSIYLDRIINGR